MVLKPLGLHSPCLLRCFGAMAVFYLAMVMVPGICQGQSRFDPDDPDEMESFLDPNSEEQDSEKPVSPFTRFLDQSVWTLGYRASHRTGDDPKLINNHLYLRHEMDTLISGPAVPYFLKLDWKVGAYPKTDHRAEAEEKDAVLEAELRQAYLAAGYEKFSVKLGNQINVWGKADTMAVTDVVSPRNVSEFIFFKLEDARFGQWMVSSTVYHGNTSVFGFVSPLAEVDKEPDAGTHYFRSVPGSQVFQIRDEAPDLGDMEAGVKLDHLFSKTEVSVMGGRFYANSPVYETRSSQAVHKIYPDYTMAGTAVSHAFESILIKFELAFKKGFSLQGRTLQGGYQSIKSDFMDGAAGVEYNANDRYFMSLELSNRHIISDRTGLVHDRKDATSLYYTLTKDFYHDTLALEYNFYYHIQEQNHFHNFQATYDLTDAFKIQARYTFLNITDPGSLMWAYKDEDRAALELQYSF